MGKECEVTVYLPEDVFLTKERRDKADKLDEVLKDEAGKINGEYETLDKKIKNNEMAKWRWLGEKLHNILESVALIEDNDKNSHYIWPAIGQHLRKELSRGIDDKKRSGTKNDHYRKCWALHVIPGTEWITNWVGWDAFTDRGDQLVYSKRLMPLLGEEFSRSKEQLKPNDFKEIAKLTVRYLPSQAKIPADIDSMPETKLIEIAEAVFREFSRRKQPY